jgi:septal ring factor EnvC (AmiA/AmiB activator)
MEEKKEKLKKREYLYIILFALFCPISIWSLVSSLANVKIDKFVYSEGHFLTIIGIIVSTVGLAITVYFIVLAVSANKIQKEIEGTQKEYDELEKKIKKIQEEYSKLENKIKDTQDKYGELEKNQNNLETKIRNDLIIR